jgi:catechol 2,3-dioxygenase
VPSPAASGSAQDSIGERGRFTQSLVPGSAGRFTAAIVEFVPIAPTTHMGPVELSVSDLDRSLGYWQRTVGLPVLARENGTAALGVDRELIRFVEEPGAVPADGYTGLYHVAVLLPDRPSLARWLAHAARDQVRVEGLSDHAVSEAIYLRDPDRHGIEIYADRPREQWEGRVGQRMTTLPLDVRDLLGELDDPEAEPFEGLPAGSTVGHVHLRVSDVPAAIAFYRDVLGFELTAQLGATAAFLSAGGYHHHLGANTWESAGAAAAPPGVATLRQATIVLPDRGELERVAGRVAEAGQEPEPRAEGVLVRDPSRNPLLLAAA